MNISSSKRLKVATRHSPRFLLDYLDPFLTAATKYRKNILLPFFICPGSVGEGTTGWRVLNKEGGLTGSLLEEMSVIPPIVRLGSTEREAVVPHQRMNIRPNGPFLRKASLCPGKNTFTL